MRELRPLDASRDERRRSRHRDDGAHYREDRERDLYERQALLCPLAFVAGQRPWCPKASKALQLSCHYTWLVRGLRRQDNVSVSDKIGVCVSIASTQTSMSRILLKRP